MDCISTGFRRVFFLFLFSKTVQCNYVSILSHSVEDNGSQCLSPNLCCNYRPVLINFTAEANSGVEASHTTEVTRRWSEDKKKEKKSGQELFGTAARGSTECTFQPLYICWIAVYSLFFSAMKVLHMYLFRSSLFFLDLTINFLLIKYLGQVKYVKCITWPCSLTLTCDPHSSVGLHHFNGLLSVITVSVTLA